MLEFLELPSDSEQKRPGNCVSKVSNNFRIVTCSTEILTSIKCAGQVKINFEKKPHENLVSDLIASITDFSLAAWT